MLESPCKAYIKFKVFKPKSAIEKFENVKSSILNLKIDSLEKLTHRFMKRGLLIFNVIIIFSLNLFSCEGSKNPEAATEDQAIVPNESSIDCGQLVQDYEKYANDFAVSVGKWKADPLDEIAAAQIEDLSVKIEEVGGKITSNMDCMYEYSDKLIEISTKIEEVGKAFTN